MDLSLGLSGVLGIRYCGFVSYVSEEVLLQPEKAASRVRFRAILWPLVIWEGLKRGWRPRSRSESPQRILVIAYLLLGDVIMLSGLLKALRQRYPYAAINIAVPPAVLPLFSERPWQVDAVAISPRHPATLSALCRFAPPDLAVIAGDNRYAWIARALGAGWIVGHRDPPGHFHALALDEAIPYPEVACAQTDLLAALAGSGEFDPYAVGEWPSPACPPFEKPDSPFVVLHVGASRALKRWPARHWRTLAELLRGRGYSVVWSCGPGEQALLDEIGSTGVRYAGNLALTQLWHLLACAQAIVCPDTGVAHMGRLLGRPTCVLVGPADVRLVGNGRFWSDMPCLWLNISVPCRDQPRVFDRPLLWSASCRRPDSGCHDHRCLQDLSVEQVLRAFSSLTP